MKHYPLETAGGIQKARFITEGDVYRLIFNSKLPAAQVFEAWVVDEVLPTIRKHGMYAIDEVLDNDELLEQVIVRLRQERTKHLIAQQQLLEARPKISYYDIVLKSAPLLSVREIAKDYGMSPQELNKLLRDQKDVELIGYVQLICGLAWIGSVLPFSSIFCIRNGDRGFTFYRPISRILELLADTLFLSFRDGIQNAISGPIIYPAAT